MKNKKASLAPYGSGVSKDQPFYPGETMFGSGKNKAIDSPHGSIFHAGGMNDTNAFSRLPNAGKRVGGK